MIDYPCLVPETTPSGSTSPTPPSAHLQTTESRGRLAAVAAYFLWGVFPLYFLMLRQVGPLEIVAHRVFWALVICLVAWTVFRKWGAVRRVFADRRLLVRLLGAGVLVSANWLIYIYAVVTGRIVDSALGYFINPLITVVLALVFLKEKLRRAQSIALLVGLAAVVVIAVGYGEFPWIGLSSALTFAFYSLVKNQVGQRVHPIVSLGVETMVLAPLAAVYIVVLEATGQGHFLGQGPALGWLLVGTGAVTAVPLLLFSVGASRLSLITLACIQYLAPVMEFVIGAFILRENMPLARWIGFALIWLALVVLTWDMVRGIRRRKRQVDEPG